MTNQQLSTRVVHAGEERVKPYHALTTPIIQTSMKNRGEEAKVSDEEIIRLFNKHLKHAYAWMDQQPNVAYLDVDYNQLLQNPTPILEEVNQFLGGSLGVKQMAAVVDPSLYRQRQ